MGVSALEPYREEILGKLRTGYSQAQLRRELETTYGVKIGSTAMSDFVRKLNPVSVPEVIDMAPESNREAHREQELLSAYAEGYATTQAALTALQADANGIHEQLELVTNQLAALTEVVQGKSVPQAGNTDALPVLRIWTRAFLYGGPVWILLWNGLTAFIKYRYGYALPF